MENNRTMDLDLLPSFVHADLVLMCPDRGRGAFQAHLVEGGSQFPWAEHGDLVIIGPPMEEVCLDDGTPMHSLEWAVNSHWVLAAYNEEGEEITLNAIEHRTVMEQLDKFSSISNPCQEINLDG